MISPNKNVTASSQIIVYPEITLLYKWLGVYKYFILIFQKKSHIEIILRTGCYGKDNM